MNTRQQKKLHVPSVRLYLKQRGVYYSTAKIFNHLPQNIFKSQQLNIFKILLRLKIPLILRIFLSTVMIVS
jgi:hypothetical protein